MPSYDERLAALEQTSVTRTEFTTFLRQQARDTHDINEKLAILLGLATVEQENVKTLKADMRDVRERVSDHGSEIASLEEKFEKRFVSLLTRSNEHTVLLNQHTTMLNQHTAVLDQHTVVLDQHTVLLNQHTAVLNEHTVLLNQHTTVLNEHTTVLNQHTELLTQILSRLPEKP